MNNNPMKATFSKRINLVVLALAVKALGVLLQGGISVAAASSGLEIFARLHNSFSGYASPLIDSFVIIALGLLLLTLYQNRATIFNSTD